MKKKLIVLSEWWSVGESASLLNLVLNVCDYVINNHKDDVYIIYNFVNHKFIYENVFDIDHIKTFVDEIHFTNPNFNTNKLEEDGYVKIWDWVYVHKDDLIFFNKIFKLNKDCPANYEVFEMCFPSKHPINTIRHEVEVLYRDYEFSGENTLGYPKPLLKLSKFLKNITKKYKEDHNLKDYEVIHFRWNNRFDNHCGPEVVDYLVSRLEEVLDDKKTYFVSTNYVLLIKKLKNKFKNILFIDRGNADFSVIESGVKTKKKFPKFINEEILKNNPNMVQLSNFMAYVEMDIINNSKRVIHCSEVSRNIISLFLWVPLLMNNVELLWIACGNNVERKYDFNGCTHQVVLDSPMVNKPRCIEIISNGRCS
jgi:hypothetical protein